MIFLRFLLTLFSTLLFFGLFSLILSFFGNDLFFLETGGTLTGLLMNIEFIIILYILPYNILSIKISLFDLDKIDIN